MKQLIALFASICGFFLIIGTVQAVDDIVAQWSFNEGSGLVIYDSAGENDGTFLDDASPYEPIWTTGIIDGALAFDGVDDYVEVPHSSSLDITGEITIEAWVMLDDINTTKTIVVKRHGYSLFIDNVGVSGEVKDAMWFGLFGYGYNSDVLVWETGEWYHIVVTFKNTDLTANFYRNGMFVGSDTGPEPLDSSTTPLYIGRHLWSSSWHYPFNGAIDELSIYTRALTPEEIQAKYNGIIDSDGDGIPNDVDNCPSEDATGFDANGDGCVDNVQGLSQVINTIPDEALSDEIKNSLEIKVGVALNSVDKEKDQVAINQLQAFINEINAQRGKKISEEAADMLIDYVNNVILIIQSG